MTEPTIKKTAGAFDIRVIIGGLLGFYGLVLLIVGLFFTSEDDLAKGDGFHVNLWTGIALLVTAAIFIAWARLRPIVVEEVPAEGPEHDR